MVNRYICVHGHFYQPPRENAWLEMIEVQDSAYPYHDWNGRISAECYGNNAFSRILDEEGYIRRIVNNYEKISFNFGPTLLAWMEVHAPDVYAAVLAADAQSRKRFRDHGSALAQGYNHILMPLANRRDKETQVVWGIRDFEHRFERLPEGMWLPETAVDLETLDILAEHGILFTILSPYQAARTRSMNGGEWESTEDAQIDFRKPYLQKLPSGRSITLFFYDAVLARGVGFEGLLGNGGMFAEQISRRFNDESDGPQLVHFATDGESYGHHHRHGDMALAFAMDVLERQPDVELTNYGAYLEAHPPTDEVEIFENTAWSCAHGVGRWERDCGCNSGYRGDWNQKWRAPLRKALDELRDRLADDYFSEMKKIAKDPWAVREDAIRLFLNRSPENIKDFMRQHNGRALAGSEMILFLKLLEMQRHSLLMYTSCGWFFDELSGMETVQVIQYAARALQLHTEIFGDGIEEHFLERMALAKSNLSEHRDGRNVYEKFVRPAMVDLEKVAAHYAISSLFVSYEDITDLFCYQIRRKDARYEEAGKLKIGAGSVTVTSKITAESEKFRFAVLHLGDHNITCGVSAHGGDAALDTMFQVLFERFEKADLVEVMKAIQEFFNDHVYSMTSLFRDEQRRIFDIILESTITGVLSMYRQQYEYNIPLVRFLKETNTPIPRMLSAAGEFVLNSDLNREFRSDSLDHKAIQDLLTESEISGISLDADTLEYTLRITIEQKAEEWTRNPESLEKLQRLIAAVELVYALPFDVNLRKVQNIFHDLIQRVYPRCAEKCASGNKEASEWIDHFKALGEKLLIRVGGVT